MKITADLAGGEEQVKSFMATGRVPKQGAGNLINDIKAQLLRAGMNPTRQRVYIAWLLFNSGDRHVTADILFEEVRNIKFPMSLATVYNTLTQFKAVGLLREIANYGGKTWFDTNTGPHYHFFDEEERCMFDIPDGELGIPETPTAPDGMEIVGVDIVVRVRPAKETDCSQEKIRTTKRFERSN